MATKPNPLVACVCITANRPEMTQEAINCFLAQDYQSRRLIVFDTSDQRPAQKYSGEGVFHWYEERRPDDTVGSLRNRANSFADVLWNPDLIAHWDSDDLCAPGRLTDQVTRLVDSGRAATGYRNLIFSDGANRWRYNGAPQFSLGTSLLYTVAWWREHPFANVKIGEDNTAVDEMWHRQQLVTADGKEFIVARIWEGNTSKKNPSGDCWERVA